MPVFAARLSCWPLALLLVVALGLYPRIAWAEARAGERIVVSNVSVIPMDVAGVSGARDLVIADGRIAAILPHGESVAQPRDERVDGSGLFVMPGLWDMHTHIAASDNASAPNPADLPSDIARMLITDRLARYLRHGVTGVRDLGMRRDLLPLAAELRARRDLPHMVYAGPLIDGSPVPWSSGLEIHLERPEDAAPLIAELAGEGIDFVKVYNRVTPEVFAAVTAAARDNGLPVAGHIPFAVSTRDAVAAGMTWIEHGYVNLFKDCTEAGNGAMTSVLGAWMEGGYEARYRRFDALYAGRDATACRALYAELGEAGVFITPTPHLDLPLDLFVGEAELAELSPAARASCAAGLGQFTNIPADLRARMIANLTEHYRELRAAGVRFLAGSDAPTDCQGFGRSLHQALEFFVRLGLTPHEALATATINPALALGRDDMGRIREGARADLLFLSANPLEDIANIHAVTAVMLGGAWVE